MKKTINILQNDGIILHLTDTTWGLAASCFSSLAVEKIYNIKNRPSEKSLILLVSSVEMLEKYVTITDEIKKIISDKKPTTVIYSKSNHLPQYLLANNGSIAIRVVKKLDLVNLINELGHPIVSTSANISGEKPPIFFEDISTKITDYVDLILEEEVTEIIPPSRIISFEDGKIIVIRD